MFFLSILDDYLEYKFETDKNLEAYSFIADIADFLIVFSCMVFNFIFYEIIELFVDEEKCSTITFR